MVNSTIRDFSIYKCTKCGLFFQKPIPTKTFLVRLYDNLYKNKLGINSAEFAFLNKNLKQEIKRIKEIEKFKKRGKLLDIGASSGFFISELKKRKNWKPTGIEFSKVGVEEAKKRFGIDLIYGDLESVGLKDSFFDVITMHSVLEHLQNPIEAVKNVNKKLKKGGFFIFNVPNIRSFEYYLYKFLKKPFPGFIIEHLYYFNSKTISEILENNGFKVVKITSRHHSTLKFPPCRPFIGIITFIAKMFFEYTDVGGKIKLGNIIYIYAKKIN